MKRAPNSPLLVLTSALVLVACSPSRSGETHAGWRDQASNDPEPGDTAIQVIGHVLDRSTGEPIVGARLEAPGGRTAVSDASGFFVISGFTPGEEGELRATLGKDRSTSTLLRPLEPGRLEVVLYLGS
jgi:hypothetical protein